MTHTWDPRAGALSQSPAVRSRQLDLVGRRVELVPLGPADHEWLYNVATTTPVGMLWRLVRNRHPSADEFVQMLWRNCAMAFTIRARSDGRPLGFAELNVVNHVAGHGQVGAFFTPEAAYSAWPVEGLAMFVDRAFTVFPLRKLYFESIGPALAQYGSLVGDLLVEEGRLREHEYVDGELVDYVILALYRQRWQEARAALFPERT